MNTNSNNSRKNKGMPEYARYLISAAILLVGVGIMYSLYLMNESNEKLPSDALVQTVTTEAASVFEGELDLEVSGTVVPYREIRVGAEVGGVIAVKHPACEAGNFVKQGTKLLEIDPRDYQLEVKTLDSEIVQAERTMDETDEEIRGATKNLEIAKADLKLQEKEYRRIANLSSSVAAREMDQARKNLLASQSQQTLRQNSYDMLLKKKERLKASMELILNRKERAELSLERTIIRAPADGVIVSENVEQGDFVTVARELLTFESTARVEVLCNLTPGELSWLRKYSDPALCRNEENGQVYGLPRLEVELYERTDPSLKWAGTLERFDGIGLNEQTKSIPCRINVSKPIVEARNGQEKALVRGMYVKCKMVIPLDHLEQELVSFPSSGLRPGDYVWVVRENRLDRFDVNVVDRTPPQVSHGSDRHVVVDLQNSGLETGDQIVTSPLPQPIVGGRVKMREEKENVAAADNSNGNGNDSDADSGVNAKTTTRSADRGMNDRSQP